MYILSFNLAAATAVLVILGVLLGVGVAPHPDNRNKESNKMPAIKNTFFFILNSFRGSLPRNGTELSRCDRGGEAAEGAVGWSEWLGGIFVRPV